MKTYKIHQIFHYEIQVMANSEEEAKEEAYRLFEFEKLEAEEMTILKKVTK